MKLKTFLSLGLFLIIFIILGLPHTHWGFKTDDFGNIWHCNISSWQEFFKFFYEGNIELVWLPPNATTHLQAFFCGLFRPLSFVYYLPQFFLFKTWAYGYFLVTISFHALAAVLLFNLLLLITTTSLSFLLALFFGFHPSLYNWLGWTSAQTYFIEMVIVLGIIHLLVKYLKTNKSGYYWTAVGLYPFTIFLKEASIVLPVWIMVGTYLWDRTSVRPDGALQGRMEGTERRSFLKALKVSSGFWFIAFGYLLARLSLFPLTSNTSTLTFEPTWASFCKRMSSRIFDFVTYVVDMFGLSWLPNSTQLPTYSTVIKFSCLAGITIALCWLFFKSSHKTLILFLLWSTLLFSWPAILMHYQPRYIYLGLPFFIALLAVLLNRNKIAIILLGILIPCNALFLHKHLTIREKTLNHISSSFRELVKHPATQNRSICFIGLPGQWFHEGSAQAVWLYRNDDTYPVFQLDPEVITAGKLDKNYIEITKTNSGFIFTSTDPETIWFMVDKKKASTAHITIDASIQKHNPMYVTWNYATKQFSILSNKNSNWDHQT